MITLGSDLTKEKAKSIIKHDTFLIVAEEIYSSNSELKELNGVYSAKQFSKKLLKEMVNTFESKN
jgi:hypothetical protein